MATHARDIGFEFRLLDAVQAAVIATNLDGHITYWNRFAENLYGWSSQEVVGCNIVDITADPENLQSAADIIARLGAGESWTGEFTVLRKDGSRFTASLTASPIFDDHKVLIGFAGISQDLTQLVAARSALNHQVEESSGELTTANQRLRELSASLLQSQDAAQRRIARELHDSVGQMLSAIGMSVNIIKAKCSHLDGDVAAAIAESEALIKDLSQEIRTMSYLLHPPLLDEMGLVSALKVYADGYATRSGIQVDFNPQDDFGRLSEDMEITCFRIVQECLTNVHRHSHSSTAAIRLACQNGDVVVEVQDRGQGISIDKLAKLTLPGQVGVGLAGMRERVRQLGGRLEINSDTGGTTVTAIMPLKRGAAIA